MTDEVVVQPEATPANVAPSPAETVTAEPVIQPEKTFTQAQLDEIVEKRLAKESRRNERERRELLQMALNGKQQQPEKPQPKVDDGPKREQFEELEDYIEARAEWRAETVVAQREAKRVAETKAKTWEQKVRETAKEIGDIEDVINNSDVSITAVMQDAIMESDVGPKLAHFLDKNPDEADRIATLSPVAQVRELTKLEDKLKAPAVKEPSKAPEPITPITGKASASSNDPSDNDSVDDWMKKRNKQIKRG